MKTMKTSAARSALRRGRGGTRCTTASGSTSSICCGGPPAQYAPPLLTTSPPGTPLAQAGVLGQPTTTILLGNETLGEGSRNGGRMDFGYWLDPCETVGFEVNYLGIGSATANYTAESDGTPILARPFLNTQTGQPDSSPIAYPSLAQGTFTAAWSNEFQNLEVLYRRAIQRSSFGRVDLVAGYRFAQLDDGLQINENVLDTAAGSVSGAIADSFHTRNEFNGGELGLVAEMRRCRWSLEATAKLALGDTHNLVNIDGETVAGTTTYAGGLLALPTNIGTYGSHQFSAIPELGINLGYDLTERLRATFGYSLIYWSGVARPGDQIDLAIDDRNIPPPAAGAGPAPAFVLRETNFWAQGLDFGLDFHF